MDLSRFPFSAFGSWMSLAIPKGEETLFFRSNHNGAHNVFPSLPLVDGKVVTPTLSATPSLLTLTHGEARIEVCFENTGTVRMRGQGCGCQLGEKHLIYSCGEGLATINVSSAKRRYQVQMLKGGIDLHQLIPTQPVYPYTAEIIPDADGAWECAIDEFGTTWVQPERDGFDACALARKRQFEDFLAAFPAVREQDRATHELAVYVNWATTVEPAGLVKRPTLLMSKQGMSATWSWDHAFNGMALAAGHPALAVDQMLTMVDHQDEFGCYPDSFQDLGMDLSACKPPVHGWAWSEMLKRMPEPPSDEVMETMIDSLSRLVGWWMDHRRLQAGESGPMLPYYVHGNDSGWDNGTMFKQGVPLIGADLSALLVMQMDVLAELVTQRGDSEKAAEWKQRADSLYDDLMQTCWRDDHFVARHCLDGREIESQCLLHWIPILLGKRLPEAVRNALKAGIEKHLTDWGLATERVGSPLYQEEGYWMGPIWAPSTFQIVTGLDRCGFTDLADEVTEKFLRMCAKSGFPENFNAVTGEPLCCPAYTWTASAFILLAERMAR
jgi:hypothetical protein